MINFVDRIENDATGEVVRNGTVVNRQRLLGMQGVEAISTKISIVDGVKTITSTYEDGVSTSTFNIVDNVKELRSAHKFTNGQELTTLTSIKTENDGSKTMNTVILGGLLT